jgi:rod shape-determining protein MreD
MFAPGARKGAARAVGLALAIATVIAPALPLGPLVAQPPLPLGVLWAAYGWAADDDGTWRRPTLLFALGLLHDQMSGGPFGLYPALYLIAFLMGRFFAAVMSSPNILSLWGGFSATAFATSLAAMAIAPIALGRGASAAPFAQAAAVTALLFPLVRQFYMSTAPTQRASPGPRPLQGARR